jgi:hypothetical protein
MQENPPPDNLGPAAPVYPERLPGGHAGLQRPGKNRRRQSARQEPLRQNASEQVGFDPARIANEVFKLLRPRLPVILCTGYSNLVTGDQAKNYVIKGFAMKPLTKKEVAALLRTVLDCDEGGQ